MLTPQRMFSVGFSARRAIFCFVLVIMLSLLLPDPVRAARIVRVGVPAYAPLISLNEQNQVQGFIADLLTEIAQREQWQIVYKPGRWEELFQWLDDGTIDLLPGLHSQDLYPISFRVSQEPILIDWGQIYSTAESEIRTILDLENKKVAVRKTCMYYRGPDGIGSLAEKFDVKINFILTPNPASQLANLSEGKIDAVVLGRFYDKKNLSPDITETPIMVSPLPTYFAANVNQPQPHLDIIDRHLRQMKQKRNSIYYQSWKQWLTPSTGPSRPKWLTPVLHSTATLIALLLGFSFYARYQVDKKTREITAQNKQLRSLSTELTLTEERERRQLAELLHDNLGQNLSLVKVQLTSAGMANSNRSAEETMAHAVSYLDEAIQVTRSLTREVSPPVLYNLPFIAAVKWLAEYVLRDSIHFSVTSDDNENSLSEDSKVLLFKTLRELLVNIVKHAQASYVIINVHSDNSYLYMEIEDNGIGLSNASHPVTPSNKPGFGLFSIRERIAFLDGEFSLKSNTENGTIASLKVPLNGGEKCDI